MKKTNPLQSIVKTYNKISVWGKILLFVLLWLIVIQIFKNVDNTNTKDKKKEEKTEK